MLVLMRSISGEAPTILVLLPAFSIGQCCEGKFDCAWATHIVLLGLLTLSGRERGSA